MKQTQYGDVSVELRESIAIVTLARSAKRNALSDAMMASLEQAFSELPTSVGAAVLCGSGDHFCAGLDLSELKDRDAVEGLHHSRSWHRILSGLEFGRIPIVAALHGAVVGGGLELATSCHIRVADDSAFFALPEGSRGIFVGGGGSVRVPKLIGVHRMLDMMLTGRVYKAAEAVPLGFAQYHAATGGALDMAIELATRIATNAPMTNYALIHGLPRIAEQTADHGFFSESMLVAIAQSAPEAKARVRDFLEGRAAKVQV
ncbi:MAG: crotonase/enoyl-CoA hydratase family protein [Rhizobacter sp.]|nr:crotonase/enoyl-CoA hydratase family protein [Burkholderiales bacterium]